MWRTEIVVFGFGLACKSWATFFNSSSLNTVRLTFDYCFRAVVVLVSLGGTVGCAVPAEEEHMMELVRADGELFTEFCFALWRFRVVPLRM